MPRLVSSRPICSTRVPAGSRAASSGVIPPSDRRTKPIGVVPVSRLWARAKASSKAARPSVDVDRAQRPLELGAVGAGRQGHPGEVAGDDDRGDAAVGQLVTQLLGARPGVGQAVGGAVGGGHRARGVDDEHGVLGQGRGLEPLGAGDGGGEQGDGQQLGEQQQAPAEPLPRLGRADRTLDAPPEQDRRHRHRRAPRAQDVREHDGDRQQQQGQAGGVGEPHRTTPGPPPRAQQDVGDRRRRPSPARTSRRGCGSGRRSRRATPGPPARSRAMPSRAMLTGTCWPVSTSTISRSPRALGVQLVVGEDVQHGRLAAAGDQPVDRPVPPVVQQVGDDDRHPHRAGLGEHVAGGAGEVGRAGGVERGEVGEQAARGVAPDVAARRVRFAARCATSPCHGGGGRRTRWPPPSAWPGRACRRSPSTPTGRGRCAPTRRPRPRTGG